MTYRKVDDNQEAIVAALRRVGASVQSLAAIGKGCPDLLVAYRWNTVVMEVKDGAKPPSAQKLTEDEQEWHARWKDVVYIVRNVDEALKAIGAI